MPVLLIPTTIATATYLHRAYKRDKKNKNSSFTALKDRINADLGPYCDKSRFPDTYKGSTRTRNHTLKSAWDYASLPGDIKDFLETFYNGENGARASGIDYKNMLSYRDIPRSYNYQDALPALLEVISEDREYLETHGLADVTRNMVLAMLLGIPDQNRREIFAEKIKESIHSAIERGWVNPKDREYYKTMYDAADSVLVMIDWHTVFEALQNKTQFIEHTWGKGTHPCDEALTKALDDHDPHRRKGQSSGMGR